MLWAWLSHVWIEWRSALVLVKPDTVLAWHRRGFRLFWAWKSRHRERGCRATTPEVHALIRRMATANPLLYGFSNRRHRRIRLENRPISQRRTRELWAHSRRSIENPGRADGARCGSLRFRSVARHFAGDWSPPAHPIARIRRSVDGSRQRQCTSPPAAHLRTTAGGGDALTCRGVTTGTFVRRVTCIVAATSSASRSPRADDPTASSQPLDQTIVAAERAMPHDVPRRPVEFGDDRAEESPNRSVSTRSTNPRLRPTRQRHPGGGLTEGSEYCGRS